LAKVFAILLNTYREAVRARILLGLFALALATTCYALVVGQYASKNSLRVISDIGSFGVSSYGVLVAIVLGATSLYREVELKTIYPILARPLGRTQYLVGKVLGTWLVLVVFMLANAGVLLVALHAMAGGQNWVWIALLLGSTALFLIVWKRFPRASTYVPIPWSIGLVLLGWVLAKEAPDDRRVVLASALLASFETAVTTALATLFSAFSSPFLTAIFTLGVFLVGRSADTLAKLPVKVFGQEIHDLGEVLARVVPNLMVYVPPRPVLTGEVAGESFTGYALLAFAQAGGWVLFFVVVASLLFKQRDFV
jgi:hypothetical protein